MSPQCRPEASKKRGDFPQGLGETQAKKKTFLQGGQLTAAAETPSTSSQNSRAKQTGCTVPAASASKSGCLRRGAQWRRRRGSDGCERRGGWPGATPHGSGAGSTDEGRTATQLDGRVGGGGAAGPQGCRLWACAPQHKASPSPTRLVKRSRGACLVVGQKKCRKNVPKKCRKLGFSGPPAPTVPWPSVQALLAVAVGVPGLGFPKGCQVMDAISGRIVPTSVFVLTLPLPLKFSGKGLQGSCSF